MDITPLTYLIVCPLCFLAGLIDSVAGGGGLISLPAYYAAGLSPYVAAGTNKLSACLGTMAATARFGSGHSILWKTALLAALGALPGSWLGASFQQTLPEQTVRILMLVMIPVAAVIVLGERRAETGHRLVPEKAVLPVSFAIGLAVGFYDGLVGPGTGTFLIILFTLLLGLNAVEASGTAKVVNLASNIAALTTYIASGRVLYSLGLPAALCAIGGNLTGASLTLRKGTKFVRRMLLVSLGLLLAKMLVDVLQ